jgi:hypothetical protein
MAGTEDIIRASIAFSRFSDRDSLVRAFRPQLASQHSAASLCARELLRTPLYLSSLQAFILIQRHFRLDRYDWFEGSATPEVVCGDWL